ncbi:MAG: 7-cyano-7-deazaguanine synthase [Thermomicrobiales bacterium]
MIRLPLRHPERWQDHHVQGILDTFLGSLSNDNWDFHFSKRLEGKELQEPLLQAHDIRDPIVGLFSGGLDSFLGVVEAAFGQPKSIVVASSVTSSYRLQHAQAGIITSIQHEIGSRLIWAPTPVRLFGGGLSAEERESSWRTRMFLFLAQGAIATVLANASTLRVTENGVGAISLPYGADQIGVSNTRATHPRTLALFSALIEGVLDSPIDVVNPALWRTKGQMCHLLEQFPYLRLAVQSTVSCDQFAYAGASRQCGRCTSCLQRGLALYAIGCSLPVSKLDQARPFDRFQKSTQAARVPLHAMRDQVERMRGALVAVNPERAVVAEFPDLIDVLATANTLRWPVQEVLRRLVVLYRSYVAEWDAFSSQVAYLQSAA